MASMKETRRFITLQDKMTKKKKVEPNKVILVCKVAGCDVFIDWSLEKAELLAYMIRMWKEAIKIMKDLSTKKTKWTKQSKS